MPRRWMKGATRVPGRLAGRMDGTDGTRKVVIHTEGVTRGPGGRAGNAVNLARYVADRNIGYHFVYDRAGRWAQVYPAHVGARSLKAGAWSPNRQGKVAIQVCFAGVTSMSETRDWPMTNWDTFLKFVESWGVPRKSVCRWADPARSEARWRQSGWTCHAAAPFNDHRDGTGTPGRWLRDDRDDTEGNSLTHTSNAPDPVSQKSKFVKVTSLTSLFRVVAVTRFGSRRLVRLSGDGFGYKKGRVKMNAVQAEKAKRWAKARLARSVDIIPADQPAFVELAPGAAWPKDRKLVARLNAVGKRRKRLVRIVSGYRSLEAQAALYRAYKAGTGNLAAYPNPNAPHVRGVAADCGTVDAKGRYRSLGLDSTAAKVARSLGLSARVPGEPWHWQRDSTY